MLALNRPNYLIRSAMKGETGMLADLRMASLLCLEMPNQSLATIRTFMSALPDVDERLVAGGSYSVADKDGDLIAGAGWSPMRRPLQGSRLVGADGKMMNFSVGDDSVLIRGFFLDPDMGRQGAGTTLLSHVQDSAARAGYSAGEILIPASSQLYYRSLGFRSVAAAELKLEGTGSLALVQMRRSFSHCCLARAA